MVQALQAEEEVRTLHGSPSGRVGDGTDADGDPAVALLWGGRETGGDVGRVERRRRRHAAELGVQPGRAVRAVVAGVARVGARARAAPPRGHQPARRQQPAVRGPADVAELAARRAAPRPRGHLRVIVPRPVCPPPPRAGQRRPRSAVQTIRSLLRSLVLSTELIPADHGAASLPRTSGDIYRTVRETFTAT